MQPSTALAAIVTTEKIGAHIAHDKARIDLAWPANIDPLLPEIQAQAGTLIAANQEAIHIKQTGEIGAIALKRKNVGKAKERIEMYLRGPAALPATGS